jgi:hypothetical protein
VQRYRMISHATLDVDGFLAATAKSARPAGVAAERS